MTLYLAIYISIINYVSAQSTCPYSACVSVTNNCGVPLYIQRTQYDGGNEGWPSYVDELPDGEEQVFDISDWGADGLGGQRLYAWWQDPTTNNLNPMNARDKVEINWCADSPTTMCYNPTSVDNFGLPVYIGPYDEDDCSSVNNPTTGFGDIKVAEIEEQCPTVFTSVDPFGVCWSPYHVCSDSDTQDMAICSSLDSIIATCQSDGICPDGLTTTNVWGCNGGFATEPEYCAALHRGLYYTVRDGGNQYDPTTFYQSEPYNPYAAFIHSTYAKQYAFPYDDWQAAEQSGYKVCTTNFMKVVWCPADGDGSSTPSGSNNTPEPTAKPTDKPTSDGGDSGTSTDLSGWSLNVAAGTEVSSEQLVAGYTDDYFYYDGDVMVLNVPSGVGGTTTVLQQDCYWDVDDGLQEVTVEYQVIGSGTNYGIIRILEIYSEDGKVLGYIKFQSGTLYALISTSASGNHQLEYTLGTVGFDDEFTIKVSITASEYLQIYLNDVLKENVDVSFWSSDNNYFQIGNNLQSSCCDFKSMVYIESLTLTETNCGSSFFYENDDDGNKTSSVIDTVAIVCVVLAVIGVIGCIAFCLWKRRKTRGEASFEDANNDNDGKNVDDENNKMNIDKTNERPAYDMTEIDVEMEMETQQ